MVYFSGLRYPLSFGSHPDLDQICRSGGLCSLGGLGNHLLAVSYTIDQVQYAVIYHVLKNYQKTSYHIKTDGVARIVFCLKSKIDKKKIN